MKSENTVRDKSHAFARRCVKLYKYLCEEKKEYILSKQLLRSGTRIGANMQKVSMVRLRLILQVKSRLPKRKRESRSFG